jgi:hypothetical protein
VCEKMQAAGRQHRHQLLAQTGQVVLGSWLTRTRTSGRPAADGLSDQPANHLR